jgi:hypothetical protein
VGVAPPVVGTAPANVAIAPPEAGAPRLAVAVDVGPPALLFVAAAVGSPSTIAAAGLRWETGLVDSSGGEANAVDANVARRTITAATAAATARRRQ